VSDGVTDLEAVARVCHEANRAWQIVTGDPVVSPSWDEAPVDQRMSARDGVQAALRGATPEQLHDEWVRGKLSTGWTFGPVKDAAARTHPCLVAYDELPAEQRTKDRLFLSIVEALTGE